jgi:hypothetical protein
VYERVFGGCPLSRGGILSFRCLPRIPDTLYAQELKRKQIVKENNPSKKELKKNTLEKPVAGRYINNGEAVQNSIYRQNTSQLDFYLNIK